ncbi:efflux RND transporter periplasmic adaptor subunit [Actinomadura sp. 6N118]|uniref:efflux RND transporter periplasmic adaptor subunit n=1 Tax=Actinomadura sp. 6N118 TaxID=3375151 RepID=UPI00379E188D
MGEHGGGPRPAPAVDGQAADRQSADGQAAGGQARPVPPDEPPPPGGRAAERRPRRRRSRKKIIAAVAVVIGGSVAVAAALALGQGNGSGGATASNLPPKTAKVSKETLKDTQEADGQLGFGTTSTATSRLSGTLTALPDSGSEIGRGKPLYKVDDDPVLLMYGSKPAYRPLRSGVEGSDVLQLERNLSALGYDGFTVDDEYTGDTADAVREWQDDKGLEETGEVELGRVVFVSGEIRVESLHAGEGDAMRPGGKVLSYTGTDKAVTVELETTDQRLAKKGATVEVTLPDETAVPGRIDEVSTIIQPASGNEDATTKVEVIVELKGAKAQKEAADYAMAAVDVTFTAGTRKDVLTVPVAALVALQEGGFGVEVVNGGTTAYVPVKTGLFADGKVEVSGAGITEGTTVGMPK